MLNDMSLYFRLHMSNFKQGNCQTLAQKVKTMALNCTEKRLTYMMGVGKHRRVLTELSGIACVPGVKHWGLVNGPGWLWRKQHFSLVMQVNFTKHVNVQTCNSWVMRSVHVQYWASCHQNLSHWTLMGSVSSCPLTESWRGGSSSRIWKRRKLLNITITWVF